MAGLCPQTPHSQSQCCLHPLCAPGWLAGRMHLGMGRFLSGSLENGASRCFSTRHGVSVNEGLWHISNSPLKTGLIRTHQTQCPCRSFACPEGLPGGSSLPSNNSELPPGFGSWSLVHVTLWGPRSSVGLRSGWGPLACPACGYHQLGDPLRTSLFVSLSLFLQFQNGDSVFYPVEALNAPLRNSSLFIWR